MPLKSGRHLLQVQYYEAGGFAELRFDIKKTPVVALRRETLLWTP